jgi:hypothetical protein
MFAFFLIVHAFFLISLTKILFPAQLIPQNLFILELIGKQFYIPYWLLFVLEIENLLLIWFISKQIFKEKFSLIPVLIWSVSPWSYYLVAAQSFYIYLLFTILLTTCGLLVFKSRQTKLASVVIIIGIFLGCYGSLFLMAMLPIALIFFFKKSKLITASLFILSLPMLFLIFQNYTNFKNILNNEIKIFSDPILLNSINRYQGAASDNGLKILARISENKYLFFTEDIFLKYTNQLMPSTFFTSKEKLLNFSFSPPIFLGFLIPFVYGLYLLVKKPNTKKYLLLSTSLILPSILSGKAVDLNRLIIFAPIIIFIISYGIQQMIINVKNKKVFLFFLFTVILITFQTIITITDIKIREQMRFKTYFPQTDIVE